MDWEFVSATLVMLLVNLVYAVIALFVGLLAIKIFDNLILKQIDLEEEIKKGNIAAAIFSSTLLIFVAIILGFALGK